MPPPYAPFCQQRRCPPGRPTSRARSKRGSTHGVTGRAARPDPAPSGPGKSARPPITGARRWNRSGTRGSEGPQRKPSARSVALQEK
ncbi:hypothetical protein NDU88_003062 [Pleurodeles waltl]|uniref:Uncharacterized protein n=1 Tax=Pleurodeles waltl TaxID=8319 RepID=A0AAV7UZL1_PLEWA|nr:hypothetical protein NDU88_003062 [Pleurodeles waltl]